MDSFSFDFKKEKETFQLKINECIILNIDRYVNSSSILYFTDDKKQLIHIPDDITIYDSVYNGSHKMLQQKEIKFDHIYLYWAENYVIEYKNQTILTIDNPRIWEIKTYL